MPPWPPQASLPTRFVGTPRPRDTGFMVTTKPESRHIHCPHCGFDNPVAHDVVGKLCDHCGKAIFRDGFKRGPEPPKATADRTGDVLRVRCPRCQFRNEFPGFDMVDVFICDECGQPVKVKELKQ